LSEAALEVLCVKYGYCLASDEAAMLLADIPDDPDAFVDAVKPPQLKELS
jgi:hypothetical protein